MKFMYYYSQVKSAWPVAITRWAGTIRTSESWD